MLLVAAMVSYLTLNVVDFGAVPNSPTDATGAFRKAFEACRARGASQLVVPRGTYNLDFSSAQGIVPATVPEGSCTPLPIGLCLEGLQNLKVFAGGAKLLGHGPFIPLMIDRCKNLIIEGLTIDFADPPMAEGTITASGVNSFTFTFHPQAYHLRVQGSQLLLDGEKWSAPIRFSQFVTPGTGEVQYNTGDMGFSYRWPASTSDLGANRVRITAPQPHPPQVGNVVIFRAEKYTQACVLISESKDVDLRSVTLNSSFGMGFVGHQSEDVTLERCNVVPAPGKHVSLAADATHWIGMRGTLRIEDCTFRGQLDDSANVHGEYAVVHQATADTVVAGDHFFKHSPFAWGRPGDVVDFLDQDTMLPLSEGKVKSIRYISGEEFEATFEGPVSPLVLANCLIENLSARPDFEYLRNDDRFHRARGILVKTGGHVLIQDNLFRTAGAAVLIDADVGEWYESGAVGDVTIKHNTFDLCNTSFYEHSDAVIEVEPKLQVAVPKHRRFERNLTIEENTFLAFDAPILDAKSVDGLRFTDNTIRHQNAFAPRLNGKCLLDLNLCRNVLLDGNTVLGKSLPCTIATRSMSPSDVTGSLR